jgi:hypothetical protein
VYRTYPVVNIRAPHTVRYTIKSAFEDNADQIVRQIERREITLCSPGRVPRRDGLQRPLVTGGLVSCFCRDRPLEGLWVSDGAQRRLCA